MQSSAKKAADGEAESLRIDFDSKDVQEGRALAMSQRLAKMGRGSRKRVIVALLAAMESRYEKTGEIVTPRQIDDLISTLEGKK